MKRNISILITIILASLSINAADLVSGSLESLKNESKIRLSLDCSRCIYKPGRKNLAFEYYLYKYIRDDNWAKLSLKYFAENFNDETIGDGMAIVDSINSTNERYKLIITPVLVDEEGEMRAMVYVKDHKNKKVIATIMFEVDGDVDDEITFRDQFAEGGEDVGYLIRKVIRGQKVEIEPSKYTLEYLDQNAKLIYY